MDRATTARIGTLAVTGGFVDAAAFVMLFGVFSAHMSGDTTHLAADLGTRNPAHDIPARIAVLVTFVVAVVAGTVVLGLLARPSSRRALLAIETGLLLALAGVGTWWYDRGHLTIGSVPAVVLTGAAGTAMGLHNVVARSLVGTEVTTTYVTGTLIAFGEDLVAWLRDRTDPGTRRRLGRHGLVWVAFLAGGIAGAAAATAWHLGAFLLPAAAVALLALVPQPADVP